MVKDPRTGRFFRLGEMEAALARLLDGEREPDEVRRRFSERFEVELAPEDLEGFLGQLGSGGFLAEGAPPEARPAPARGGPWWAYRVPLVRPARLIALLLPAWRLAVSSPGLAGLVLLLGAGASVLLVGYADYARGLGAAPSARAALTAWALVLGVTALHELSHALSCASHGGEVREIGFLLLYGMPAFYCDVSDAWLFPDRARRLSVTFAGPACHLAAWASLVLVWRATEPGSWLHGGALYGGFALGLVALFNFNPLIKLDGYYLLSDLVAVPNLRARSFAHLGAAARAALFGLSDAGPERPAAGRLAIYWGYGLLAWAFTLWMFAWLGLAVGAWLVERLGMLGWWLVGGLVLWALQAPARSVWSGFRSAAGELGLVRFLGSRFVRLVALLALAGVGAAWLGWDLKVGGQCSLEARERRKVRTRQAGRVAEVAVREGQAVRAGDLLVRLDRASLEHERAKLTAQRDKVQAELALLDAGRRPEEIERARLAAEAARVDLKVTQARLDRLTRVIREGGAGAGSVVSKHDLEVAEKEAEAARIKVLQAKKELDLVQAPPRPEERAQLSARLREIDASLAALADSLASTEIRAPIAGVVVAPEIHLLRGAYLAEGAEVAEVTKSDRLRVKIEIDERDILEVRRGARVEIKLHGRPERTWSATVEEIGPTGTGETRASRFEIVCHLTNDSGELRPRMTGYAKVLARRATLLEVALRPLAKLLRLELWW